MSDFPQVKLIPAYAWVCEACNHLTYAQCEAPDRQELEELYRAVYEMDDDETLPFGWDETELCVDMYRVPEFVKCIKCSKEYETERANDSEFEEVEDEWGDIDTDDSEYDGGLGERFKGV